MLQEEVGLPELGYLARDVQQLVVEGLVQFVETVAEAEQLGFPGLVELEGVEVGDERGFVPGAELLEGCQLGKGSRPGPFVGFEQQQF